MKKGLRSIAGVGIGLLIVCGGSTAGSTDTTGQVNPIIQVIISWEATVLSVASLLGAIVLFITNFRILVGEIKKVYRWLTKGEPKVEIRHKTLLWVFFILLIAPAGVLIAQLFINDGPPPLEAPFEVSGYFYPSGWMGDVEGIQLNDQWKENCHSAPTCIRITYRPGKQGWAGIYWQYPDSNWGESPGRRIEGASRLTFWARGERGGELVQFKAGGIYAQGRRYYDSFEKVTAIIELTQRWQRHEIDLAGANLSSVLGAFAWTASRSGNPEGLTFYLDDIRYE